MTSLSPPLGVLHLCAGNLYGGVERIVAECALSRGLVAGMQPSFAVCFEGRLSAEIDAAGARCGRLGAVRVRRPLSVGRFRRALARLLAEERPDAVICHSAWIFALAAPVLADTPLVRVLWLHDRVSGRTWIERWARRTTPDLVLCNSAFTAGSVKAMYPGVTPVLLYAPVADRWSLLEDRRAHVRGSLGIDDGRAVILIASRFEPWKGHRDLLAAAARIAGPWRIWIAGGAQRPRESQYERALRALAVELHIGDRVHFLGERTDMPAVMRAADILCQPNSGPEPFGLAFVEALYAGLPVVTTAAGGALEILDERCGVLVPPGDAGALERALARLVNDAGARRALGAAGPSRARHLCDPARQLSGLASAVATGRPVQVPA